MKDQEMFGKYTYSHYAKDGEMYVMFDRREEPITTITLKDFQALLAERDEYRKCPSCKHKNICCQNVLLALGSWDAEQRKIDSCSAFEDKA